MAETSIEWTKRPGTIGKVVNPTGGCSDEGEDCAECYAKGIAYRIPSMARARGNAELEQMYAGLTKKSARGRVQWTGVVRPFPMRLDLPLQWKKPCTVFIDSMSDMFHADVPFKFSAATYGIMALTQQHTYLGLTKRGDRKREFHEWIAERGAELQAMVGERPPSGSPNAAACMHYLAEYDRTWLEGDRVRQYAFGCNAPWPLPNVWEGVSCGVRDGVPRIDELRRTPAALRFLSLEPLLEDLGDIDLTGIDWVITGGESGNRSRACKVEWLRRIVRQCRAAGIPVFVKQLGARYVDEVNGVGGARCKPDSQLVRIRNLKNVKGGDMNEWPEDLRIREYPRAA